jgi:hypothetical protein
MSLRAVLRGLAFTYMGYGNSCLQTATVATLSLTSLRLVIEEAVVGSVAAGNRVAVSQR